MRVSVWVAVVCPGTGRVLLAQRGPAARKAGQWNFFGGRIDQGEHPEDTALRELSEEAGIEADRAALIHLGSCRTGTKRNLLFAVTAEAEFEPIINHESQAWSWVAIDDLPALRRLHEPTQKLAPLVRRWADSLPKTHPPRESRWDWLLRHVARSW